MRAMDVSEAGIAFLKDWEPFRPRQEPDADGLPVIGYGHRLHPGERWPDLTPAQGDTLLRADLRSIVRALNCSVPGDRTQAQFDALASLAHWGGPNILLGTELWTALRDGYPERAAERFADFAYRRGQLCYQLMKRRLAERALFLGELQPPAD
jgi:lysozyme